MLITTLSRIKVWHPFNSSSVEEDDRSRHILNSCTPAPYCTIMLRELYLIISITRVRRYYRRDYNYRSYWGRGGDPSQGIYWCRHLWLRHLQHHRVRGLRHLLLQGVHLQRQESPHLKQCRLKAVFSVVIALTTFPPRSLTTLQNTTLSDPIPTLGVQAGSS